MKLVFISGPYRGDIEYNIKQAEKYARMIAAQGIGFICPHLNSGRFDDIESPLIDDQWWLSMYIQWLELSDAIFLIPGWRKSAGALAEHKYAIKHEIPVFDNYNDLFKWAKARR